MPRGTNSQTTSNVARSRSYLNPLLLKTFCKHFHVCGVLWTSIPSTSESSAGFHKTTHVFCCVGATVVHVHKVITQKIVVNSNTHHRTWCFSPLRMIRAMLDCSRMNEQHCLLVRCIICNAIAYLQRGSKIWFVYTRFGGHGSELDNGILYISDTGSGRNTWRFGNTAMSGNVGVENLSLSTLLARLKAFQLPWSFGL